MAPKFKGSQSQKVRAIRKTVIESELLMGKRSIGRGVSMLRKTNVINRSKNLNCIFVGLRGNLKTHVGKQWGKSWTHE